MPRGAGARAADCVALCPPAPDRRPPTRPSSAGRLGPTGAFESPLGAPAALMSRTPGRPWFKLNPAPGAFAHLFGLG
jgi:hypothetical protein